MRYFLFELRRAVISKNFIVGISLICITLFISAHQSWYSIAGFGGFSFFLYTFSLGELALLPIAAPLIVPITFADSYLKDKEHNMIYAIMTRSSLKKYYITRILVNGIASALTMFIPLFLLLLINLFLFDVSAGESFGILHGAWSFVFDKNQFLYSIIIILNSTLFAFIYGNVGLVATLFVNNKLFGIVAPFTLYILPSFILPFFNLTQFEAITTFDLSANSSANLMTVYGQLFLIFIVIFFLGMNKIKRELVTYGSKTH